MKTHRLYIIFAVLILFTPSLALGITGNQWKQDAEGERASYVGGVVEGWFLVDLARDEEGKEFMSGVGRAFLSSFKTCMVGMTYAQITAIAEKYMSEHPDQWHQSMPSIIFNALSATCHRNK